MATAQIYNGYGQYEQQDGKKGITLTYAGIPFFLPFREVTYFPNYNLREVDHEKSTGTGGQEAHLTYENVRVTGDRIVTELIDRQIPLANKLKGIIPIKGTPTGRTVRVFAGIDAAEPDPTRAQMWEDVPEVVPTPEEVAEAERLAESYEMSEIQNYRMSKRELMSGGKGQRQPSEIVRKYMDRRGVKDIDDVDLKQGLDPATMATAMALAMQIMEDRAKEKADHALEEATRP